MTNTKIIQSLPFFAFLLFCHFSTLAQDGKFSLDTKSSEVEWTGYHPGKSYEHWGTLKTKSGFVSFEKGNIAAAELLIDMNTLQNSDLINEGDKAKLSEHLKSVDFFDVAQFPEAKIIVKKSTLVKTGTYSLTADITIKGITKEIKFDALSTTTYEGGQKITAEVTINRTDFNVMFGWTIEDAMIDKEIKLDVLLILKQANKLNVDLQNSEVEWTGYHPGKSYEHWGTLGIKSGALAFKDGLILSGEVVIDMNTLSNTDLINESDKEKLVEHLKSPDFFDVKNFEEAKLLIKKSIKGEKNTLKITADITIKGITKEITFDATATPTFEEGIKFAAEIIINRVDFKVMFGWAIEDAMIDRDIKLDVLLICH